MMKKINKYLAIISLVSCIGCENSGLKEKLNFAHKGPDEFTVLSYKPLSVPPNFDLPEPEVTNSHQDNDAYHAESVIFKRNFDEQYKVNEPLLSSSGEELLLKRVGEKITTSDIKALLAQENQEQEPQKKTGFFNFFSKKKTHTKDIVENPEADKSERVYKSKSAEILRKEDLKNKTKKQVCDIKRGVVTNCEGNVVSKEFSIEIPAKHNNSVNK